MPNAVDICNLALSHLGDRANVVSIDPPEGSAQAEHCARFYPIARDMLLAMHPFSFATKRVALNNLTATSSPPAQWEYTYAAPNAVVKILGVFAPNGQYDEDKTEVEYELGSDDNATPVLYSNIENAIVRYTTYVVDTTRFPPLFTTALSYVLASYLSGPIIKGREGMQIGEAMLSRGVAYAGKAFAEDANQRNRSAIREDSRHTAPWLENRGSIWPYTKTSLLPNG